MAIMEISVLPMGTGTPSASSFVADCVKIVSARGFNYELTAMGTVIEGEVGALLELAQAMHNVPFSKGVKRVVTNVTIDALTYFCFFGVHGPKIQASAMRVVVEHRLLAAKHSRMGDPLP